ncbi:hypothetical protein [Cellulosimicrobium cellulans]|uniref:hypothetical protein n=1 Tax=Cellulosimicrobium cellulans TaxID=1710 RepID=UPI0005BB23B5|nr:hypothetical protein [Cellulosimicrobium cellulans]
MTGDEYIALLEERRAAYEADHPIDPRAPEWARRVIRPLLEWFVEEGDEEIFTPPPAPPASRPARTPRPRTYRTAASLREERDRLRTQLDALNTSSRPDTAVVNLSPSSRSRAARSAGRRRFASLDRDITRARQLIERIDALDAKIRRAEHREKRATDATSRRP